VTRLPTSRRRSSGHGSQNPQFAPATWEAFRRFALEGIPAAQVAAELGLTVNAVTLAKSRVLKRLRKEAGDLLK
jgi:RNA polymerase sigma-70 factor (ECF subfamily)